MKKIYVSDFINFIDKAVSPFHSVDIMKSELAANGYEELKEGREWEIIPGKGYYVTRNDSSLIAFKIPENIKDYHFQICASHSDSPTYKVKNVAEINNVKEYIKLNVEPYGGMIDSTWLDKPLSLAGRVVIDGKKKIYSKNLYIDKDILLIPNLAIHMNREINKGYEYNKQVDLCPLFSAGKMEKGDFEKMLKKELKIKDEEIVGMDLYLVNRQKALVWGYMDEFISAPKLDDLSAAYTALTGLINSDNKDNISVMCCFDNEEVGSGTMQGALSTFLKDTLIRINRGLGMSDENYYQAVAKSFMLSFDNAHALHPNHPEKYDSENRCYMNKGIVIKENAAQKYTTNALSRGIVKKICDKAKVPTQTYANRSDMAGGSTLGNLSNTQVSLLAADIGLAQLAMHSSYETMGSKDIDYAVKAVKAYYDAHILIDGSNVELG